MATDLIEILKTYQDDQKLGAIAKQALEFICEGPAKQSVSSGKGSSSFYLARLYNSRQERKSLLGVAEAVALLGAHDVPVHLATVYTDHGLVLLWLADDRSTLVAVIIAEGPSFMPEDLP